MITDKDLIWIWMACGLMSVVHCVYVVIRKRKWKKSFLVLWPILFVLGPIGLLGLMLPDK